MYKSEIFVEFLIEGFEISCNELTKQFGINPTEYEDKGTKYVSKISGKEFILKISNWRLDSGVKHSQSLEYIFKRLLKKMRPFKNRITPICKKHRPFFNIIIHIYGNEYPAIVWENDILKEITEYNGAIGIDISFFSEDEKVE